jgi:hypothetical protein
MLVGCLQLLERFHLQFRKMFTKCCSLLLAVVAVVAVVMVLFLFVLGLEEVLEDGRKEYLMLFPVKQLLELLAQAVQEVLGVPVAQEVQHQ